MTKYFLIVTLALSVSVPAMAGVDFDNGGVKLTLLEQVAAAGAMADLRPSTPFPVDTDPYLADANSDLIFNWLSADADANMPVLQAWLVKNGITESVTEFMFHKKFAAERERFAAGLKDGTVSALRQSTPFPVDTDPYLADANSDLIFNWLSADADANMPVLQAWLVKNNITESVTEFMFHKKFAAEREKFAAGLR